MGVDPYHSNDVGLSSPRVSLLLYMTLIGRKVKCVILSLTNPLFILSLPSLFPFYSYTRGRTEWFLGWSLVVSPLWGGSNPGCLYVSVVGGQRDSTDSDEVRPFRSQRSPQREGPTVKNIRHWGWILWGWGYSLGWVVKREFSGKSIKVLVHNL